MDYWKRAEIIVSDLILGTLTPGSGRGRLKGDVVTDTIICEIKQTSQPTYTLARSTLNKIKYHSRGRHSIFAIVFELRPYAYLLKKGENLPYKDWSAMTLTESCLPEIIITGPSAYWELTSWEQIRNL